MVIASLSKMGGRINSKTDENLIGCQGTNGESIKCNNQIRTHDAMSKHANIFCMYLDRSRGRTAADVVHGDDIEQVNGVSFKASNGVMIGADVGDFFVFHI